MISFVGVEIQSAKITVVRLRICVFASHSDMIRSIQCMSTINLLVGPPGSEVLCSY